MEKDTTYQKGSLKVSEDVISTIARIAAQEIEGVDCLAPAGVTLRKLFIKSPNDAVSIHLAGDVVEITLGIIAKHGCRVTAIAEAVQESVKSDVQSMTGITVSKVNVIISGIAFDDKD